MFELDPILAKDTHEVGESDLCKFLLMNDSQFPWIILVPKIKEVTEIFQLSNQQQNILMQESNKVLELMAQGFNADKMNVAALGNLVSQLHIHHVARFKTDIAWPAPVWGHSVAKQYSKDSLEEILFRFRNLFKKIKSFR
ncbi:HIT domain-containing protein [Kangiella sp. HZ709]|uniref:HIT domain-containing protein n=1 Tax=Kangiella sp. HZ709 TaxID=2666328 RepID=UPI0012AF6566|nr:HIT domain-containing protein [Kangiella sp. HZ709]MRX27677.1 HIT domain-containing protein [Kangiella sp. HZ709]